MPYRAVKSGNFSEKSVTLIRISYKEADCGNTSTTRRDPDTTSQADGSNATQGCRDDAISIHRDPVTALDVGKWS
jgi:hypothetical protein